ncbi:MAG: hypothetical protein DMG24_06025 [Acidobacteria bacterium]|nr:MAG: hypothetical protein DMG24_06025 [Acidobacteriota bacterium]
METDETQYFAKFRAAARPECRFQNIAGGAYMPFCGMCAAFGHRIPAASRFLHAWQSGEARLGYVARPIAVVQLSVLLLQYSSDLAMDPLP